MTCRVIIVDDDMSSNNLRSSKLLLLYNTWKIARKMFRFYFACTAIATEKYQHHGWDSQGGGKYSHVIIGMSGWKMYKTTWE